MRAGTGRKFAEKRIRYGVIAVVMYFDATAFPRTTPEMFLAALSLVVLAAIWIGYPIVIAVLAALVRRPVSSRPGEPPLVSVILATRDSGDAVRKRVANLLASHYPPERLEVVVAVDAASSETLPADALSDARVRETRGEAPGGKALTLNAGVAAARGEVLVFADVAQSFASDAVGLLVEALGEPLVGAASGRLVPERPPGVVALSDLYWGLERRLRSAEARLHSSIGVTGAIWAMRRELFEPLPPGLILDDLYTPMRLVLGGHRIAYVDQAVAIEPRRFAAHDERRRKVRTLTGVLQLCRWLPAVLVPVRNPVWAQFVAHKLLRFVSPVLVTIAAISAAVAVARTLAAGAASSTDRVTIGLVVVVTLVIVAFPATRRAVSELAQMHLALVEATVNGMRGSWDVW